eukprot:CAMPEP_0177418292 /NCGR_PEP_ID=MMETSP0368-20130122/69104_1 /TAXON_ID=447022 ORGANISM="Scrippsiella hangoei-like, Strain SHHI-4" /NCGR_SAMPLE_ID=MMETSP0368 /ASSEMBLY_ACC=CAM_ASM_000363 /LENGTH=308 /DNA_ID=CAMNT_0018887927 /DNA_START=39 /DNA_END=965 /DNA_ORIENTATION=-
MLALLPHAFVFAALCSSAWAASAPAKAPVAVTGSTGKLGRRAVQQLVEQGYPVRCLLRHDYSAARPSDAPEATSEEVAAWLAAMPGVTMVPGDVTNRESVVELLRGCSACLAMHGASRTTQLTDLLATHAKRVNFEGVRHIIEAARASSTCKRIVRVTGKGEQPWSPVAILINGLGSMAKAWNFEGERLLRACDDIDYTIVRPGMLTPGAKLEDVSLVLADDGGDLKVSSIPHESVAQLCVRCFDYPNAARSTLCAMTYRRKFPGDELFKSHVFAVFVGGVLLASLAVGLLVGAFSLIRSLLPSLGGI